MPVDSFDEFVDALQEIESKGFIETHRAGNTGIGKTLEDLLGIEENNIPGPDAAGIELKSTRRQSNNLTTLFTKEPPRDQRELWNQDLVRELGYVDSKDRQALKVTIGTGESNNRGFYLDYDDNSVSVVHDDYGICATYPLSLLRDVFERKLPELILVIADVEKRDGREYFHYNEAYHLDGFDGDDFLGLMRDGVITLDLRMHIKDNGNIRNRGTAWRIMDESRLDEAFEERTPLLDGEATDVVSESTQNTGQNTLDEF
ncbi:uncharacterized protein HHUB_3516 [Halobacterium hubeiense]|uniref:MvaI/BcnI restriction endonuclease domain-containing protein n=1 Tax=Halobacterium hubeiense TaxID=1407499 RepID=A0A0U5H3I8_9EURY|nr:MvaI/BcnI family restriction endonuclease [Halobacterium hubeiense]CQH61671.1 uncharacterized protein HHUB_3516 [Halobacterium hubeiense]